MGRPKKEIEPIVQLPEPSEAGLRTDQYEVIVSGIRRVENDLASIDRDLEHDRQDMQDFKIRLGSLEDQVKELRNAMNHNAERVKDKVADVVQPMQKEVSNAVTDLKDAVEKKKVLAFNKERGFLSRLFRRK